MDWVEFLYKFIRSFLPCHEIDSIILRKAEEFSIEVWNVVERVTRFLLKGIVSNQDMVTSGNEH